MFRYKRTNVRQRDMARLKTDASDQPLFTGFHSLQ
jgi:hypothetical protein